MVTPREPKWWLELFHNLAPNAPGWDPAVVGQSAPHIVSELWLKGADLVRDLLYEKREELKVTVPALQDYYLTWHRDLRLLEYALRKLHHQDRLTRGVRDDLQWRVHNQPQLKNFLKIARQELTGEKEENSS